MVLDLVLVVALVLVLVLVLVGGSVTDAGGCWSRSHAGGKQAGRGSRGHLLKMGGGFSDPAGVYRCRPKIMGTLQCCGLIHTC